MPIIRINSRNRHLRVIRDTNPHCNNKPSITKQAKLTKQKVIVPDTRPFWKRWFAFFKIMP